MMKNYVQSGRVLKLQGVDAIIYLTVNMKCSQLYRVWISGIKYSRSVWRGSVFGKPVSVRDRHCIDFNKIVI